jgi:hypothetical protein
MQEAWKEIEGYEGIYQISNKGNVKVVDGIDAAGRTRREKLMHTSINRGGYQQVMLRKNGTIKLHRVHRLVATAFIENPNQYGEVNHKDENKLNNGVDNLEWCTHQYNSLYGTRVERTAEKRRRKVIQYSLNGDFIKTWNGIRMAGRACGDTKGTHITNCCTGKANKAYGYIWKYAE